MFLWFVAVAVLLVFFVFDSAALDYRFVVAGSVLPLAEAFTGSPWLLHTLTGSAALLVVVMLATAGRSRRLRRRRWLGLPVGTLLFLVAAGVWADTDLFWWPLGGTGGLGQGGPPEFERPLVVLLMFEVSGLAALGWLAWRCELGDRDRRNRLLSSGRLVSRTGRKWRRAGL